MRKLSLIAPLLTTLPFSHLPAQVRTGPDANQVYAPALYAGLTYRMIGPTRGGRVTAVAGVPSQPHVFYLGATGGGVWKTTDYGLSWVPISDGFFETGSIGSIRVADSDPNIIYVGTGSDGIRSNVIQGKGVYRSGDAGKTWRHVGLRDGGQIGAVLIHPSDPNTVYIAAIGNAFRPSAERGVYRTRDGGATWQKVLFVTDSTGAVDLEFAPDNPREIYAAMWRGQRKPYTIISGAREGGIYKSTDGGDNWSKLSAGLPRGLFGKSDLAVSPADPGRVYALIEAPEPEDGLYRSDDRGQTWTQVSSYNPILNRPFYYTGVDADPTNADIVWVNNEGFYYSADGGKNWERRDTPHGDNHDMWINPNTPSIFIQSNDGGANVTLDGGRTWSTQFNQPTAELYQVDLDDQFPYQLYAGQQDNTTITVPSLPPFDHPAGPMGFWRDIGGCETGPAVPKPGDPDIVYANCKGLFGRYSRRTGQEKQYYIGAQNIYGHNPRDLKYRFQRVAPIEISPHDPNVVYMGSQFVHRTVDEGVTWETISPDLTANKPEFQVASGTPITRDITGEEHYQVIYDIEESPLERGVIWVGANDGPVHVTRDNGRTWTNVTPTDLPPDGRVQNIDVSPHTPGKAYVAAYRYLLGDDAPYLYRTADYGRTWTRLTPGTNGIPADHPTRVVREDPVKPGLLYAGTQYGLFVSFDDGAHWQTLQQNLPATPVNDIQVVRGDLAIATMGRSFWILDNVAPLRELSATVASANAHLFQPRDAYRMRYSAGFGEPNPSEPQYLPPGAIIDYHFAADQSADVSLEILDAQGAVIRTFTTAGGGSPGAGGQEMRGPFAAPAPARLSRSAGMHRFIWDLSYPGPGGGQGGGRGGSGPLAAPGRYQARLAAGGWTATKSFNLLMDPRIERDGVTQADLAEQLAFSLKVRDAITDARQTLQRVRDAQKSAAAGSDQRKRLDAIEAQLATASANGIRYPQPMLVDQLSYLYGMVMRADQRVGRDAHIRYDELSKQLEAIKQQVGQVVEDRS
jgi:photosystem II stability/assembly factor-like uncharacterized protein